MLYMDIEICTVSGYNEVGRNMTAVRIEDEVILLDMGVFLPAIIDLEESIEAGEKKLSTDDLIKIKAIPDDTVIKDWKNMVKAIVIGHCHLDHTASIPYLAPKYKAPIIGTPYTIEIIKSLLRDEDIKIPNQLKTVNPNSMIKISENIKVELINVTHSTLQSAIIAIHTKKGVILYVNDFKLDDHPIIGDKTNFKRLKELSKEGVLCMIVECLYANRDMKTPSEKVAREMLKDVMVGVKNENNAIFVTTFASHVARIKSIIDFADRLNRKVFFLGRSMAKYLRAAENLKLAKLSNYGKICGFTGQVAKALREVEKNKGKYVVVCTGSQGEPGSILDKLLSGDLHFSFKDNDNVIFSCITIPAEQNIANRKRLEEKLKSNKVRIFKDIHVSGHASSEDLRDFITMVNPKNIIPSHGDASMSSSLVELAEEIGYKTGENVFAMRNGQKIKL